MTSSLQAHSELGVTSTSCQSRFKLIPKLNPNSFFVYFKFALSKENGEDDPMITILNIYMAANSPLRGLETTTTSFQTIQHVQTQKFAFYQCLLKEAIEFTFTIF
jgi:hypothetical protein